MPHGTAGWVPGHRLQARDHLPPAASSGTAPVVRPLMALAPHRPYALARGSETRGVGRLSLSTDVPPGPLPSQRSQPSPPGGRIWPGILDALRDPAARLLERIANANPTSSPGAWTLPALELADACAQVMIGETAEWSALYANELAAP